MNYVRILIWIGYCISLNAFQMKPSETFEYRVFTANKVSTESIQYHSIKQNGKTILTYTNTGLNLNPDLSKEPAVFLCQVTANEEGLPLETDYRINREYINTHFQSRTAIIQADWKEKRFSLSGQFQQDISTEPYLILRTMPLKEGYRRDFDYISYRDLPALASYPMFFEVKNTEKITVPAGSFYCRKILFTVNDWRSLFFSAIYYVSDDPRHWIVKVELYPFSGGMELLAVK